MSSLLNLRTFVVYVLMCLLCLSGLLPLTARQSHASNNPLPHPLTPSVNKPSEESVPQVKVVDEAMRAGVHEAYGKLALSFEANQGQFDRQAQFLARGGGYNLFLTSSEAVLVLTKPDADKDKTRRAKPPSPLQAETVRAERDNREVKAIGRTKGEKAAAPKNAVLRMKLEGTNAEAIAEGLDELPGKTNYFIGHDPNKWHTDIPSYARVMYRDVYPGVDVLYYGRQQQLEYDFRIAPGANPDNIRLAFEGTQSIEVDAQGDLVLHTEAGDVRQHKPVVYQEVDGAKREIQSRYEIKDEQRVGFHVEAFDKSKPLVIDPALLYSTYLGSSSYDEGTSIAVDAAGNAYIAGTTYSYDFPLVNPVADAGYAFVSKLNRGGSALIYSTYIGDTSFDAPSIAVDMEGCAYIAGTTDSPNFPVVNAVQSTLGGIYDPFVTKLSPQGSALVYSTYLGGSNDEGGAGIAVDAEGDAYVTGYTYSNDFPVVNAFQAKKAGNQAFKSTDGGGSWRASDSGLGTAHHVFGLAIDPAHPSTIYSAADQGVFKSTNSGSTWRLTDSGPDGTTFGGGLAIDPSNTSTLFFGTAYGLLKSTSGGGTWATSLPADIETVVIDPVHTSTIYASASGLDTGGYGSIVKSTDGGSNWQETQILDDTGYQVYVFSLAVNPINSSILYAGTFYSGIYRSTNGGASWHSLDDITMNLGVVTDMVINPSNPSIIYASGSGNPYYDDAGVYKSTDGGNHWQVVNNGLPTYSTYIDRLAIDPVHPNVLYASSLGGIYKTTDGGAQWNPANTGMTTKFARAIAIDPTDTSKVYAVTDNWEDAFVTKLSPSGSTRLYSTFLGGDGTDRGNAIALDSEGNAYLTGLTYSAGFPLKNPLPIPYGSAFVTKLDATGSSLVYSTRLGGSDGIDVGLGIAVDASGNAYVTGETMSTDFPVTPGAFQTVFKGDGKAFVTKINAEGSSLVYSTYLGGSSYERANGIAVNSSGQAFVTGETSSRDFPLANATQGTLHNSSDAFVTRLDPTGSSLVFSTYLGGSNSEYGNDIAVDSNSNAYVTGYTYSTNFPTTPNAFQSERPGYYSAFITKIGEPPASIKISGRVLLNGAGLAGVTVTLKNNAGAVLQTATTPDSGSYSFTAKGGGNYTVTPSKPNYTFHPLSLTYTKVGTNLPVQNFEALQDIITIQIWVPGINGNSLRGVRVVLSGSRNATCTTGIDGLCAFTGLSRMGRYTVTPSKAGAAFRPTFITFNNPEGDQVATFKGAFSISGQITGLGGIGIGGVTIKLSGDRTTFRTTDDQGNYKFTELASGGHYILTPTKGEVTFNHAFAEINSLNAPMIAAFHALVSITGKVRLQGTTTGISGVTMKLIGSRSATTTTNSGGIYTFSNLPAAGTYTVKPSETGYTFSPPSRTFTNLKASQGFTTSYFDGTP